MEKQEYMNKQIRLLTKTLDGVAKRKLYAKLGVYFRLKKECRKETSQDPHKEFHTKVDYYINNIEKIASKN